MKYPPHQLQFVNLGSTKNSTPYIHCKAWRLHAKYLCDLYAVFYSCNSDAISKNSPCIALTYTTFDSWNSWDSCSPLRKSGYRRASVPFKWDSPPAWHYLRTNKKLRTYIRILKNSASTLLPITPSFSRNTATS